MMELKKLQEAIHNWNGERFPNAPSYLALIKVAEELGELAGHYIGRIEQRVGKPEANHNRGIKDAVGDVVISLCVFCEREGLDLEAIVETTWAEVSQRIFVMKDKGVDFLEPTPEALD